ncbi:MAG: hypothetical protein WDA42_05700, partial [Candidatus Bathyarchaeia archaeon]
VLSGSDFQNVAILVIFNGLFVFTVAVFVWKRLQFYKFKAKKKETFDFFIPKGLVNIIIATI